MPDVPVAGLGAMANAGKSFKSGASMLIGEHDETLSRAVLSAGADGRSVNGRFFASSIPAVTAKEKRNGSEDSDLWQVRVTLYQQGQGGLQNTHLF